MQTKVEICGVNTSGLPVLSAKKTDELLKNPLPETSRHAMS